MDDGRNANSPDQEGRDIPPDEDRLNYVYPNMDQQQQRDDLQADAMLLHHPPSNGALSQGFRSRGGLRVQEPMDTTPDAVGRVYENVFPAQRSQPASLVPNYYLSEDNRLGTFADWRYQGVVRREDLARNGFVYTGTADKVRCIFCSGILRQWDQGDVVENEHQRNFPSCPFISGQNVGNIPSDPNNPARQHIFIQHRTTVATARPQQPGHDIGPMEDRYGACCDPSSNPQKKDSNESDALSSKNNSGGASPRGTYAMSPRNPSMAVEPDRLATFSSWPAQMKQKPEELARAGLYYLGDGDKVKCFHCDGLLYNWDPEDDVFVEHARWFPDCQYIKLVKGENFVEDVKNGRTTQDQVMQTPAVLAVLAEGYGVEIVQRALTDMRKKNGADMVITARDLLNTVMEIEGDMAERKMNGHVSSEDLEKLQRENDTLRDKQLCKICMECDVEVIFYPCKHFVCCAACSAGLRTCPICREAIDSIDKVFMS